ncbi:transglutaminase family protein [uncultured Aquabacterium sp.]|uniref:transglutaminase family protein n=1 Tax=uncultured Aquabacterium sp. TaxID=158753 RepID=UPI0025FA8D5D|nr:transglutaminase family protein [uncultured Aquabacterium sp.]
MVSFVFDITHTTTYRYARPVKLGEHRVMFRPRDSHDLRVLATDLQVTPGAQDIRLIQDVYSNSVAIVQPVHEAQELTFVCTFTVEHTGSRALDLPIDAYARHHPFRYSREDRVALAHYLRPYYLKEQPRLRQWAQTFLNAEGPTDSREVLVRMNKAIRDSMTYQVRNEEGVQTPCETLDKASGTCRDFATLMIEAARALGYAARFVSGYVYGAELEQADSAGATHAWLQVYLPGAGWIPFDPTNNLIGGHDLIRVGVARHASLASPLSGTWTGAPADYLGMTVDVQVRKRA